MRESLFLFFFHFVFSFCLRNQQQNCYRKTFKLLINRLEKLRLQLQQQWRRRRHQTNNNQVCKCMFALVWIARIAIQWRLSTYTAHTSFQIIIYFSKQQQQQHTTPNVLIVGKCFHISMAGAAGEENQQLHDIWRGNSRLILEKYEISFTAKIISMCCLCMLEFCQIIQTISLSLSPRLTSLTVPFTVLVQSLRSPYVCVCYALCAMHCMPIPSNWLVYIDIFVSIRSDTFHFCDFSVIAVSIYWSGKSDTTHSCTC